MKFLLRTILPILLFITLSVNLKADTILLNDGTYLVGKVIEWDSHHIIFKNAHGAFAIRKNQLVKLYITGSQKEDIELRDKLGHTIKDEDIIRHYLAGAESVPEGGIDKTELESDIANEKTDRKLKISLSYYQTLGRLADIVPSALGITFGYTQSLSPFLSDEHAFWAPDINIEPEMVFFSGEEAEVYDFSIYAGPEWRIIYPGKMKGSLMLTTMPGATYLIIKDNNYNSTSFTYSFKASAGYEYPVKGILASVNLTYLYIYDKDIPLKGIGVTVSGSYKF